MSTTADESSEQPLQKKPVQSKQCDANLICFCCLNYFLNAAVSVLIPFYPPLAKNAGLSTSEIGYVFAINPAGSVIFSLVIGSKMGTWGRKRCMIGGLVQHNIYNNNLQILQVITIITFGLLANFQNSYSLFISVSLLGRFFQGISRAAYSSISFAYVSILWPESIQQKISIMEALTGQIVYFQYLPIRLGLMSGPFIGAGLYYFLGYQVIFYSLGALFAFSIIPSLYILPEDNHEIKKEGLKDPVKGFKNKNVLLLFLVFGMLSFGNNYISPIFSLHMETFGIKEDVSSLLLGTITVSYVMFIFFFVPLICKKVDKKIVIILGILISSIGVAFIAPVLLPNKWWVMLIGLPLIGIGNALCILPAIPQYIEFLIAVYPAENKVAISDMASGLFIGSYTLGDNQNSISLGVFIGPLLGGLLYDLFSNLNRDEDSFKYTSIIVCSMQLFFGILFFFFGDGYKGFISDQSKVRQEIRSKGQSLQPQDKTQSLLSESLFNDIEKAKTYNHQPQND